MRKIILASGSIGRKELLERVGLKFVVDVSNFDEDMNVNANPQKLALEIAEGKARKVAPRHKDAIIIAADSFIVLKDIFLGKPKDKNHAKEILGMLSGKQHVFLTGFIILDTKDGKLVKQTVETKVWMKKLTEKEIESYVLSKEPFGKAGGYALLGKGGIFIEKIEGSVSNIIGLPMYELAGKLKQFGIEIFI